MINIIADIAGCASHEGILDMLLNDDDAMSMTAVI